MKYRVGEEAKVTNLTLCRKYSSHTVNLSLSGGEGGLLENLALPLRYFISVLTLYW